MLSFLRRYQIQIHSILAVLLGLYIVTAASAGQARRDSLARFLLGSLRPLQAGLHAMGRAARNVEHSYVALRDLWRENQRLRIRVEELEAERNRLVETEITNRRLQELLQLKGDILQDSVAARVIGNSASAWFRTITVDKGEAHGIRKGMAAISPKGVVGKVISVSPETAKVMLVTDHSSGIDILTQRTRSRGIVSGSLDGGPVVKYVGRNEDVRKGDRIITSGLDGIFPKGLLVGSVSDVRQDSDGLFQRVRVDLSVDPSQIEEVLFLSRDGRPAMPANLKPNEEMSQHSP